MEKTYSPEQIEPRWRDYWIGNKLFHADERSGKPPFSIVIPPPNVTGSLHLGHALNNTLQDMLCRYMRMCGREVLWMPGTDHAGIATQNVVERELAKQGLSRAELGRERFVERVWEWKEEFGGRIISQLKRLGCSCDWDRERFTMDEGLSVAVRETFVRLYREGLIYRGKYMINWCPRCESALADLEVEYPDEPEQGMLYRLRYPLLDGAAENGEAVFVDTTRPETMLGDTAVAVNPGDERYSGLIGRSVMLPIVGRIIPIIADEFVDPQFGTGAVKVTPGHDVNDFEAGRRHDLPIVSVIGSDGKMTREAGKYEGLDRFDCRAKILDELSEIGVLVETRPYGLKTGRCYRCQAVTEPLVSKQWFVRMKEPAERAAEAVRSGRTRIVPALWSNTYFQWLDNIRDWCISRQLWWGHQIPVWYCAGCEKEIASVEPPQNCDSCGSADLTQDRDVLDTWFSSALWPFSTMGWPVETETLRRFYPTSVLVTGFDILFFWVARMMMMGLKMTDEVPFADIYLHAMVRDEHGQKMSKTKGNTIDPLEIIDQFGADALRFSLAIMTIQGRDVNLSMPRIEGYRNFINKIWNAVRFVLLTVEQHAADIPQQGFSAARPEDFPDDLPGRWIRSRLARAIEANSDGYRDYQFSDICTANYRFFWDEFCAWYLEITKLQLRDAGREERVRILANLLWVVDVSLRLLHPSIPFVTEELWTHIPPLNASRRDSISRAQFPSSEECSGLCTVDTESESEMELLREFVSAVRTVRSEKNLPPARPLALVIEGEEEKLARLLRYEELIRGLARVERIDVGGKPADAVTTALGGIKIHVPLGGLVDFEQERARLSKEITRLESELQRVNNKLSDDAFKSRAPAHVIDKERQKLEEFAGKLAVLRASAADLG